jgi:hypothetical protein
MDATRYRIEYWLYDEVILLAGDVEGGEDLETMLAPYVSQLRGGGGVIAVVSEATGMVVARRAFWPAAAPIPPERRAGPGQAPGS